MAILSTKSGEHVATVPVPDEYHNTQHVVVLGDRLFVPDIEAEGFIETEDGSSMSFLDTLRNDE